MPTRRAPPSDRTQASRGPTADEGIEEVERAIATLAGVDPERDAQIRKTYAESDARRREEAARLERDIASGERQRRERLRRWTIRSVVTVVVVGVAAGFARPYAVRWMNARPRLAAIAERAAGYAASGFSPVPKKPWELPAHAVLALDAPACVIALGDAREGPTRVRLAAGGSVAEGVGSVGLCTCSAATVDATSTPDGSAVRIYRAEPGLVGGAYGLHYVEPKLGGLGPVLDGCSNEPLDAWVRARRFPPAHGDPQRWAAPLAAQGFEAIAALSVGMPLVAFDAPADGCAIAIADEAGDLLTLRTDGGDEIYPETKHAIGWCSTAASPYSLLRKGKSAVHVAAAPSKRIGAALGLSEIAARAGLFELPIWIRPEDLAAAAADALGASGVEHPVIVHAGNADQAKQVLEARLVSIALIEGGLFLPDPGHDVPHLCLPDAMKPVGPRMCVQASPHPWSARGAKQNVGAAQAPLPFWMLTYAEVDDPLGLAAELAVLRLARRLSAQHFVPTTLEGVAETETGAAVLGRAGEDAIVAVGLAAQPPWTMPYTDGPAWTLDGDPRIVPLSPGDKIVLAAKGSVLPPVDKRRTLVFRRQARP